MYLKKLPVEQGRDSGPLNNKKNIVKYNNNTTIIPYYNNVRYAGLQS